MNSRMTRRSSKSWLGTTTAMPPEHKNGSAKKLKTANRKTRKATAQRVSAHKVAAQKATPPPQAKKPHARSASRAASSTSVSTTRPASPTQSASLKHPSVAIIGAGRLGSALARALSQSGYAVVALVARHAPHARRAARALSPQPLALGATQLDSLPDTDLLLITTPDDQIKIVAARLTRVFAARDANAVSPQQQRRRPARVALHASGALVSDALAPLAAQGFSLGSLHPLVSISDPVSGASNLRGAFYCLEGEARALSAAKKIVRALGGQSFSIDARHKPLYHAAAVMSAGHLVALFSLATQMLAHCGLSERQAARVLLPLAKSTLENLARGTHPASALTGPFARADVETLRRHLSALREFDTRETLPVYVALGRHALQLARARVGGGATSRAAFALIEAMLRDTHWTSR
jgi:predicted short-subunit dehydrogenase-like oxidoreductase (DUF2520 family)